MIELVLVFIVAFLGSAVQTVVGFGLVIFLMALLPLFLPVNICIVISQLAAVFMGAVLCWGKGSTLDWKKIVWPAAFSSAGSIAGLLFLSRLDNDFYMLLLGAVLILLALWMVKFSSWVRIKPTPLSGSIVGTMGGVMGSLFGVSAPPMVLYFSDITDSKDGYVANLQLTLLIQTGICLLGRVFMDMWPCDAWQYCIPVLAGSFLGMFPGKWLYNKLNMKTFKLLVYSFMGILGAYFVITNL